MSKSNFIRIRRFGIVNVFLVEEEDGLTVIDTALPGTHRKIVQGAGVLGQPIKRILLTHAHDDHVGGLDRLHEAVPEAEVLISARDARILAGDLSLDDDEPQDKLRGGLKGAKTTPTRTIADGEQVGSLRVIATPGHTPGHVSLLDERDGTLYAGDVYSTLGGMSTTATVNPLFPLPAKATWRRDIELESAEKLIELAPDRLAPGHGRVVELPVPDMRAMVERARKKLKTSEGQS